VNINVDIFGKADASFVEGVIDNFSGELVEAFFVGAADVHTGAFSDRFEAFQDGDIFGGIKTHQKITFAKNLGLMISAGLPMTRALSVMGKQSKSKPFKKLLSDIEADVSHGKTLSESLNKWPKVFSALFVSMFKAG
jgi:type II secretory pathway component PulF